MPTQMGNRKVTAKVAPTLEPGLSWVVLDELSKAPPPLPGLGIPNAYSCQ